MQQLRPYLLSNPLPTPASGVTEPALKKKPIAALLDQTYGEANAKTVEKSAKFTPPK